MSTPTKSRSWYARSVRQLIALYNVPDNYDGQGSRKPCRRGIRDALVVLDCAKALGCEVKHVSHGCEGEVTVEFRSIGRFAEIDCMADGMAAWIDYPDKPDDFWDVERSTLPSAVARIKAALEEPAWQHPTI